MSTMEFIPTTLSAFAYVQITDTLKEIRSEKVVKFEYLQFPSTKSALILKKKKKRKECTYREICRHSSNPLNASRANDS